MKTIFELEYILKTSPKVLNNILFTESGLAEWFCDDVTVKDTIYYFKWKGYVEEARLISMKSGQSIRWQWIEDEEEGLQTYFELKYDIDPVTNSVVFTVTSFADEDEMDESMALWDQHIQDLKRVIGAN